MSNTNYKLGDEVYVSDDGKNWFPSFLVGYNSDVFYCYIVKRNDCEDEIGFRFCVPAKVYRNYKKRKMTEGMIKDFYIFLHKIPSGIRGNVSNKELISKYLSIQKTAVLKGFESQYEYTHA